MITFLTLLAFSLTLKLKLARFGAHEILVWILPHILLVKVVASVSTLFAIAIVELDANALLFHIITLSLSERSRWSR